MSIFEGGRDIPSAKRLRSMLVADSANSGFFGLNDDKEHGEGH
ncbi:hypothetical protein [Methylobacter sp. BlB1]|nr:hypothetical protein [Methylobacter sp. BlB1]